MSDITIYSISGSRPPKTTSPVELRQFNDLLDYGYAWVDTLDRENSLLFHGGAPGIDSTIGLYAQRTGMWVQPIPAPWDLFERRGVKSQAGFARNGVLVDICHEMNVFWNGESRGTRDTIVKAIRADKLRRLWLPDGEVEKRNTWTWARALAKRGVDLS